MNQMNTNDHTKSKINVALLHQKLKAAKALQLNNSLAGNIFDEKEAPIAKIVTHEPKANEHTPTASINTKVVNYKEKPSYSTYNFVT